MKGKIMKLFMVRVSIGIAILSLIAFVYICVNYHGKKVHLSFDDCYMCLRDISVDSTKHISIFDNSFLGELRSMHESTGAKFTLYIYEQADGFNIKNVPAKFISELRENSEWLKIGYHAKNPTLTKDSIAEYSVFSESFTAVDSALISKSIGGGKTTTLRLHFYFATPKETVFLKDKGITRLLSADDDRISYSLSEYENNILKEKEEITKNGITYVTTDLRVERDNLFAGLWKNRNDTEFVIFTHEWAYNKGIVKWKFLILVYILSICNSNFIN